MREHVYKYLSTFFWGGRGAVIAEPFLLRFRSCACCIGVVAGYLVESLLEHASCDSLPRAQAWTPAQFGPSHFKRYWTHSISTRKFQTLFNAFYIDPPVSNAIRRILNGLNHCNTLFDAFYTGSAIATRYLTHSIRAQPSQRAL